MCNLYTMRGSAAEVARLLKAKPSPGTNTAAEIYPGYNGTVVADGLVRSMVWGFPLTLKGKSGQPLKPKPVNNTRSDKLDSFMWRDSFAHRRCLIPVSAFAEAEGPKGQMTRTWFSLPDQPIFCAAGIWRESDEWGPVYSMIMTDACPQVDPVHNRMPVLLSPQDWDRWTLGTPAEAAELCVPYQGEIVLDRAAERWAKGSW
jgi:putative SOS response-associated peptidase YedK